MSPAAAKDVVDAGRVRVAGAVATRPTTMVTPDVAIDVTGEDVRPFVSRAGGKLVAALDRFEVDPGDADASTPGPRPVGSRTRCCNAARRT